MKKLLPLLLALFCPLTLLATAPDKTALKKEVAAMEDAFCAMAQDKGLLAAFEHFAAPDVAFIDTDPRKFRGPEAVRTRMGPDQPGVKLTWSAMFTDVSDDGTLGYNYGRYESRRTGPDGKELVRGGFFLTIWKRQPDGSWRYVMDNGAPDRPTAPAATAVVTPPASADSASATAVVLTPTPPDEAARLQAVVDEYRLRREQRMRDLNSPVNVPAPKKP